MFVNVRYNSSNLVWLGVSVSYCFATLGSVLELISSALSFSGMLKGLVVEKGL